MIGVSDSFYDSDVIQGERFISGPEIPKEQFDYIILGIKDRDKRETVKKKLVEYGVDNDRIIGPGILALDAPEFIPDMRVNIQGAAESMNPSVLIMGLSYSLRGINAAKLDGLDLSWHGQDLYYNLKWLDKLKKNHEELYGRLEKIILVIPYYYFNYDSSVSAYQYETGQIYVNRSLYDYHNAFSCINESIRDHLITNSLFGESFWRGKCWRPFWEGTDSVINLNEKAELLNIWKKTYHNTILENKQLIIKMVQENKEKEIILVIPPVFLKALREDELRYFDQMKKHFFNIIEDVGNIRLIDCNNSIVEESFFSDYEHLNNMGRDCFTSILLNQL